MRERDSEIIFRVFIYMKQKYTKFEFEESKSKDLLKCECYQCRNDFLTMKKYVKREIEYGEGKVKFCSYKCLNENQKTTILVVCKNCEVEFKKLPNQIKKSKNHFCSRSCAATYNNTHKKHGTRKSKLEIWLEAELIKQYPNLEIHFNRKDVINSELDIYIPRLKLGFELNGIYHYEPIFGSDKLSQIQNNDNCKFQACLEHGIELCIIDTSQQVYFKEKTSQKYLTIINNVLNSRLSNK